MPLTMQAFASGIRALLVAVVLLTAAADRALAGTAEDVLSLYRSFATAQNNRDLAAVRNTLSDSPQFLWVSDGTAVWGREALIERMQMFQQSDI